MPSQSGIPGASLSYWAKPYGFAGLASLSSIGNPSAIGITDYVEMPGNPGVYTIGNGQTYNDPGTQYSVDQFLAAMKAGHGAEYVRWMQAHGLPVAYANPTTEATQLKEWGYQTTYSSSNPIYTTEFAKTGILPANSEVTYGTQPVGTQPYAPSSPPIQSISSFFPAGSLPSTVTGSQPVTTSYQPPTGGQGAATGPQGAGVGTGNYQIPTGTGPNSGLESVMSNTPLLLGIAAVAALFLLKR